MNIYLIAHMPRQEGTGRLAQKGTGMVGQTRLVAKTSSGALALFNSRMPEREATAIGVEGVEG